MAYSKDLRKRIITAVEKGELTQAEILRLFQISRSGYTYLINHVKETGSIKPKPYNNGRPPKFKEEDIKRIKEFLSEHSDATLEEILEHTGKDASIMAVHRTLKKIGYRLKKNHYSQVNKKEKM
jgi:transposase